MTTPTVTQEQVSAFRRFNREYTRRIGVLNEGLLASSFSLTEARILYELAQGGAATTATDLGARLGLDAGYLSRLLASFERKRLVTRTRSVTDARRSELRLTVAGKAAFKTLDVASDAQARSVLASMSGEQRRRLLDGLLAVTGAGDPSVEGRTAPYLLRPHRIGDMGCIVSRQAVLYAEEFGWNAEYEALVGEIVSQFLRSFDPMRERCWIAERDGRVVGSVFLVKHSDAVGKLRLLYVEPSARGLGIGQRLVDECIASARQLEYRELRLWTNSVLVSARAIYEARGFRKIAEKAHRSFGVDLVGQTWSLRLRAPRVAGKTNPPSA